MAQHRGMIREYGEDLRLIKSRTGVVFALVLFALYIIMPIQVDDSWANVFVLAGVTAIGALGLNLLTGYTGLPSLGTAAFIAIGAFTGSYLGRASDIDPAGKGWPFWAYTLVAILLGGLVGFIVGVPALRLRGVYLSIATLAIVFITLYVLKSWDEVSGGNAGTYAPLKVEIFGLDFVNLEVFGKTFGRSQSLMYLVWFFVFVVAIVCNNVVRSRPGRALQAVRDRDVAAEVVGVSLFRSKVGAFVISSAIAALAGVLYGIYSQYLQPDEQFFGLNLSIQYLAIIVVGGIGTAYGPIIGALLIGATPQLIDKFTDAGLLPFVKSSTDAASASGISKGSFEALVYAGLIIVFLVTEPNGLAGLVRRVAGYFRSWPLSR